ncbi:MAG: metallophosphoesterase [Bacteroidales bacterium]|jgi:serine/threonine protein phosphatase 1|nr:metallophosphoesterase [Bacteroidales bacterium]
MIAPVSTGRILAISDIHGCYTTFMALIEQLHLQKSDNLFITGDMINRGKGTKKLIKTLIALKTGGYHIFPIRGNHEEMLITTFALPTSELLIRSKKYNNEWLIDKKDGSIKTEFFKFFVELPYFYSVDSMYFVHGGFNFSLANPFKNTVSMLNYRGTYNQSLLPPAMRIVHGHTPMPFETITQTIACNERVINIDNGCVLKNTAYFGNLLCLDAQNMELFVQPNIE